MTNRESPEMNYKRVERIRGENNRETPKPLENGQKQPREKEVEGEEAKKHSMPQGKGGEWTRLLQRSHTEPENRYMRKHLKTKYIENWNGYLLGDVVSRDLLLQEEP